MAVVKPFRLNESVTRQVIDDAEIIDFPSLKKGIKTMQPETGCLDPVPEGLNVLAHNLSGVQTVFA